MYRVWYSTLSFARFIIENTDLLDAEKRGELELNELFESDANRPRDFHTIPTHIKNILYLDCPDIIVEKNSNPIFSIEESKEAGTGHNVFQRFARIAASVENNVPVFYIYPEAKFINRSNYSRWDKINPLIFQTLEKMMRIYNIPALLYYYPNEFSGVDDPPQNHQTTGGLIFSDEYHGCPSETDSEMVSLFQDINLLLARVENQEPIIGFLNLPEIDSRRDFMNSEFQRKGGQDRIWSPLTATMIIPTSMLINHLKQYSGDDYQFTQFLSNRRNTLIYKVNSKFRGDPYTGAIAGIDYLKCRIGKTYEDRSTNLVLLWGEINLDNDEIAINGNQEKSISEFTTPIKNAYENSNKILLTKDYSDLRGYEIPRYFMQVRFGGMFSKKKEIRVYSYFCDGILFHDGAFWREG